MLLTTNMSDSESQRVREISRLYSRSGKPFPVAAGQAAAELSPVPDVVLNSLCQLGLYRFDCTRSIVCLVQNDKRHVVAEASISVPATAGRQYRDSGIDFATNVEYGPGSPSSSSSQRGTHSRDSSHPFFYTETSLRSPLGHTMGTYSIMDKRPREKIETEAEDLEEIAEAISKHLDNIYCRHMRDKNVQMMKGLSTFVGGNLDMSSKVESIGGEHRPQNQANERDNQFTNYAIRSNSPSTGQSYDEGRSDRSPSAGVSPGTLRPQTFDHNQELPMRTFDKSHEDMGRSSPISEIDIGSRRGSTMVSVSGASAVSDSIPPLLSQASSLIRECLDVDGVLFFDTSRANARRNSTSSIGSPGSPISRTGAEFSSGSSGRQCEILGVGFGEKAGSTGMSTIGLPEDLLLDLVSMFPAGQVLHSSDDVFSRLKACFPKAESFLFLPVWDWNRSRWLASTLLWSIEGGRFNRDDIQYLQLFGNSIVAAVAQVDFSVNKKAKLDFMSSISHELRSPLHGVLGNIELLQSTDLQPSQLEMVKMAETCSSTLLDTMNYLLDFAKINNLTTGNRKDGSSRKTDTSDLATTFDLSTLVEEVVSTLYAGHRSHKGTVASVQKQHDDKEHPNPNDTVSVMFRADDHDSWIVHSVTGIWRRIVMNLCGNALKFTKAGFVEVSLTTSEAGADPNTVLVHLSVADSGNGISLDFLENQAFTPFTQENILTEGAGLGLSIVHQLVNSLGGQIDIKSEVGIGTQVDVFIPVGLSHTKPLTKPISISRTPSRVYLVGFEAWQNRRSSPSGTVSRESKRKLALRRTISSIVLMQPGWTVSFSDSLYCENGEIAVIEWDVLRKAATDGPIHTGYDGLLVIGGDEFHECNDYVQGEDVVYVTQPIGPSKILEALSKFPSRLSKKRVPPIITQRMDQPGKSRRALSEAFASTAPASPPMAKRMSELRPSPEDIPPAEDVHVLIVDDNEINLKILESFMRKIGSSFETASNGLAAVEKYKKSKRQFDFILMDISMPIMDGITASSRIRDYEQSHGLLRTTIMAVTGVASSSMQERAFDAGVDDYLIKPLSLNELKRIMNVK